MAGKYRLISYWLLITTLPLLLRQTTGKAQLRLLGRREQYLSSAELQHHLTKWHSEFIEPIVKKHRIEASCKFRPIISSQTPKTRLRTACDQILSSLTLSSSIQHPVSGNIYCFWCAWCVEEAAPSPQSPLSQCPLPDKSPGSAYLSQM